MTVYQNEQDIIIRTERGLTIAGTRITLYDVNSQSICLFFGNFQFPQTAFNRPGFSSLSLGLFGDKKRAILGLTCSNTWFLMAVSISARVFKLSVIVYLYGHNYSII